MKKQQNPYHFLDVFCLRVPLFSLDFYKKLFEKEDVEYDDLKKIWEDSNIKEAIFLASPYFYSELELLFKGKVNNLKKEIKLKGSFLKYIIRASTRSTPFGLFAGISIGNFKQETDIVIGSITKYTRKTSLDMNYLVSLSSYLSNKSSIKKQLVYYPNSSLYKLANQYRYIEYQIENLKRMYSIEGIEYSNYIEQILNKAKTGEKINTLANLLVNEDITKNDATDFINELIDNQILVSQLEPSVTGDQMLLQIINTLKRLENCSEYIKPLLKLQQAISKLDSLEKNEVQDYKNCYSILDTIGVNYDVKYVFQTDLFIKNKKNVLSKKIAYNLKNVLPLLNTLSKTNTNSNLKKFKKAFSERYHTRKIPLAQALDIEMGVGYIQNDAISDTVPFLNDITPRVNKRSSKNNFLTDSEIIIQKLLFQALKNNEYSIELKDHFFKDSKKKLTDLPDTFSALIEVIKINNENKIYINALGGTNGANLLTRFSKGNKELLNLVTEISSIEKKINFDTALVEIVHLPEARIGNVIKRPHLRDYELPFLGKSNLPFNKQISINDLLVSIKNNRIVLWSKKMNKEVLPRLTNAHNFSFNSLPIYHFLCDLQTQNKTVSLTFSWRSLSKNQSFLPRVCYKNIILSKATWVVETKKLKSIIEVSDKNENLLCNINEWRSNNKIPKYVQLKENDNTLLINLENITLIQLLLASVKNKENFILEEFLFTEDAIVINKTQENFANQCIITFFNESKLKKH
ncbi:lantibiotic dehydratase family protein [Polaribacter sp. Q13]|uniref:lantibiotic dehydratase family protein n=1 Tax=Polaribacter sp. Q13 TaxID=2806551 RepID=UPI00193B8F69|nr:lantibiotic dehydratase family protein [Polaribacter sp. Q13]QVY64620.1 lantibiotic dehydratase family protein [Polaribacter sp. Q13]